MTTPALPAGAEEQPDVGVPLVHIDSDPPLARDVHALPSMIRVSHSEGAVSPGRSSTERLTAHIPWQPSRLRRSGSLTALGDGSTHSLPQPLKKEDTDPSKSGHSRSSHEGAPPTSMSNVRQALQRMAHSEPFAHGTPTPHDRNNSPSRQGGLRLFWPLARMSSRDEPFIPENPFRNRFRFFSSAHEEFESLEVGLRRKRAELERASPYALHHLGLQVFSIILLRIPSMYFSRMTRIFEEAEVTRPEMQRLIDGVARGWELTRDWTPPNVSPALARFKLSWEEFIDTLVQEWKTLNVVSALLLSAILTMFQIDDANNNGLVRAASLFSLICATWSLIYGGIYIMRFRTMRSMYKASIWAQEVQMSKMNVFWNVWILLALPAVWLAWSMIAFFVAILAFVWTSGSSADNPQPPPRKVELVPRIIVTALFALGLAYFIVVVQTFRAYGKPRKHMSQVASVPPDGSPGHATEAAAPAIGRAGAFTVAPSDALGLNLNVASAGALQGANDAVPERSGQRPDARTKTVRDSPGMGGLDL